MLFHTLQTKDSALIHPFTMPGTPQAHLDRNFRFGKLQCTPQKDILLIYKLLVLCFGKLHSLLITS